MKKAVRFSVRHPVSILMYFMLICLLGLISVFSLNINFLPQIKERFILVKTEYPGVGAKEIRKLLTIPLEEIVTGAKGIKGIQSVSREGVSVLELELDEGTEMQDALLEIKSIIDSSVEKLPDDSPKPAVLKKDCVQNNFMTLSVFPKNGESLVRTSAFAKDVLKQKLLSINGISSVRLEGEAGEEIRVVVDKNKAAFHSLSLTDIARTLNSFNYEYPAGTLQSGSDEILLKTDGSFKSLAEILETPFSQKTEERYGRDSGQGSGRLYLKDFAVIEKTAAKSDAYNFYNGIPCVTMTLFRSENSNPVRLSRKISMLIKELHDKNYEIRIVNDGTKNITRSILMLAFSATAGFVITFLILRLFFKSVLLALFAASVIPFSLFWTASILMLFARSINLISLSGITICLGMIIDNCIIAIMSIIKESGGKGGGRRQSPKNFDEAIETAIGKISLSNSASTLTTIIVFLPLFFIKGILGELFMDLAVTVVSGMIFSLIFSWTIIPAVSKLFLEKEIRAAAFVSCTLPGSLPDSYGTGTLSKHYLSFLRRIKVGEKNLFVPLLLLFSLLSVLLFFPLKKEIQAAEYSDTFDVSVNFLPGTGTEDIVRNGKALSKRLLNEINGIDFLLMRCGFDKNNAENLSNPRLYPEQIHITLRAKKIKKAKAECKRILSEAECDFSFGQKNDLITQILNFNDDFMICSESPEGAREEAEKIFQNGFVPNYLKKQTEFIAKDKILAKNAISSLALSSVLKDSLDGIRAFPYYENGNEIPVRVMFPKKEFEGKKNLERLVVLPGQNSVQLSSLGKFKETKSEEILFRYNKRDAKIVRANPAATASVREKSTLPNFLSVKKKAFSEIFSSAAFLLMIVLLLLYCLLGAQTQSFTSPLIFLTAIPPAFFGAELFLLIFAQSLNVNSLLAFVVLFGTAVNNSIIIFEAASENPRIENVANTLQAVLVTSGSSIAALIPFAFDPLSLNAQSSMSLALAGGLLVSMAAVLVIVPDILLRRKK